MKSKLSILTLVGLVACNLAGFAQTNTPAGETPSAAEVPATTNPTPPSDATPAQGAALKDAPPAEAPAATPAVTPAVTPATPALVVAANDQPVGCDAVFCKPALQ